MGVFDAEGRRLTRLGRKSVALLTYLSLAPELTAPRERLADLLWPDRSSSGARSCLRQTALAVRRLGGFGVDDGLFVSERDYLGLRPGAVDCDASELLLLTGGTLPVDVARVFDLYKGAFVDGFSAGSEVFELWAAEQRILLRSVVVRALHDHVRTQPPEIGSSLVDRLIAVDPTRETSHQLAMEIFAVSGQRDRALRQYQACRAMMAEEFGVAPSAETERILRRLLISPAISADSPTAAPAPQPAPVKNRRPTILVAGLDNLTGDDGHDLLIRGLLDAIVIELADVRELAVLDGKTGRDDDSTNSPDYVITGSLMVGAGLVRVSIRLYHRATGELLSGERFSAPIEARMDLIDDIAQCVALLTRFELLQFGWRILDMTPPDDFRVRLLLLKSHARYYEFTTDALLDAVRLAEEALEISPSSVRALRMLSLATSGGIIQGVLEKTRATIDRAVDAARAVTRAVPDDVFSRCVLAWSLSHDGLHEEAVEELRHAIQLNPLYATAHADISEHYALLGFISEAIAEVAEATRLSPQDPVGFWRYQNLALARFAGGDDAGALENARRMMREKPGLLRGALLVAAAAAAVGLTDEASQAVRFCLRQRPQLRVDNVAPGFMPRYVRDEHHDRFLTMLRRAGLPE
jgi:DNA-binding SARP family transcriptional activator/tetratricopeptide (TPR) repeat protein